MIDWFESLNKPAYTLSAGMVKMTTYLSYLVFLVALGYLVKCEIASKKVVPVILFAALFLLSFIRPFTFFGLHALLPSLILGYITLIITIAAIISLYRYCRVTAYILFVYLLGTIYTVIINYKIFTMN